MSNFNKSETRAVVSYRSFNSNLKMSWILYNQIIRKCEGKNYKRVRLRIAFFLLAITNAKIGEIRFLKVKNLRSLEKKFYIDINQQTLLIADLKARQSIKERRKDFLIIYRLKCNDDYIFTKTVDTNVPLRRETLTRLVNNELSTIGYNLGISKKLTSRVFQDWG